MPHDPEWDEFVEEQQRKLVETPRLILRIPNVLAGIEPPPFDDPRYVERCNRSFKADFAIELKACRERWLKIIYACLGGEYGRDVRDDWQAEYPGVNPETLADAVLMQAAQAVWKLKGSRCVEKMPTLRLMPMPGNARHVSSQAAAMAQIPPPIDFGYGNMPRQQGMFDDMMTD